MYNLLKNQDGVVVHIFAFPLIEIYLLFLARPYQEKTDTSNDCE